MRPAIAVFVPPSDEQLRFIRHLGVNDVILWGTTFGDASRTREDELDAEELLAFRRQAESNGLSVFAVETLPSHWYNEIILGSAGAPRQLEHFCNSIRALARAGITTLGYNWFLHGVWRTSMTAPLRGGASGTAFDAAELQAAPLTHGREYDEEFFWSNYSRFLEHVLPVAEREGVRLALHPNDPPVERIGGIPFLFRNRENFRRALALVPSRFHGLTLCLGCWSEMGEDCVSVIEEFGSAEKIFYVHFQAVEGCVPRFHETFVDQGKYGGGHDAWNVLSALHRASFSGVMIPGHVPQMEGDIEWRPQHSFERTPYKHPMGGYRARAFTVGYLRGMLRSLSSAEEKRG